MEQNMQIHVGQSAESGQRVVQLRHRMFDPNVVPSDLRQ